MVFVNTRIVFLLGCVCFGQAAYPIVETYLPPNSTTITTTGPPTDLEPGPDGIVTDIISLPPITTTSTTTTTTTTPSTITTAPTTESHGHHHDSSDPLAWLRDAVPGEPGDDYPIYWKIPETSFTCDNRGLGLYADVETRCQVFRICTATPSGDLDFISMLCPNGTIFNQQRFTCEWWNKVDCDSTEQYYILNELIGVVPDGNNSDDSTDQTIIS